MIPNETSNPETRLVVSAADEPNPVFAISSPSAKYLRLTSQYLHSRLTWYSTFRQL